MDASALQGLYWYNGAMNYVFFHAVLLLLLCVLLSLAGEHPRRKAGRTVLAVLLAVLLAGGNHVTAFMGILLIVGFGIFAAVKKRRQNLICCVITLAAMVAGFLFNVTSPGTRIRQSYFSDRPGVAGTIVTAVKTGIACINSWMGLAVIVTAVLLLPVLLPPGKEDTRTVWIFVPLSAACLCVVGRLAVRNVLPAHLRDGNAGGRPADKRGIFFPSFGCLC